MPVALIRADLRVGYCRNQHIIVIFVDGHGGGVWQGLRLRRGGIASLYSS